MSFVAPSSVLPIVPIGEYGDLDPEYLPVVLSPDFYTPYLAHSWAQEPARLLEHAHHEYLHVFMSWGQPPQASAPIPVRQGHQPTIHDVIEALLVLKSEHAPHQASLESHSMLQSLLNRVKKMKADENRRMHELHERYPLLTLRIAERVVQAQADKDEDNGGGSGGVGIQTNQVNVINDAEEQWKQMQSRFEKVEENHARKNHVLLSSVLSLGATVASFIVLYVLK
jgi:hypothetical protein